MPNRSPARGAATTLPKIAPIRLIERPTPFDDPDWIFELKYDGFRALAYIEHATATLVSLKVLTYKRFESLCAGIASAVKARDAIIDGEIACLDGHGTPRFGLATPPASPTMLLRVRPRMAQRTRFPRYAAAGAQSGTAETHPDRDPAVATCIGTSFAASRKRMRERLTGHGAG